MPEWERGTEELYPGWEWGTEEGSPSCQQPCSPLLPGGGVVKGLSQLRVATGGGFQTWPGKGAKHEAGCGDGDACRAAQGSQQWPAMCTLQASSLAPGQSSAWPGSTPWGEESRGSEGKGQDHTKQLPVIQAGCQHPACTASGPRAWVQRSIPLPVTLNPQLTCKAGMEQSSIQPPPLWPFLCHGLLLKAWFL